MATGFDTDRGRETDVGGKQVFQATQLISSLPKSVHVDFDDDRIIVREDWLRWHHPVTLAGIALFVGGLLMMHGELREAFGLFYEVPLPAIVVLGLLFGSLGYWALAGILNATTIKASPTHFSYRVGPLPWIGHLDAHVEEIDQFYVVLRYRMRRRELPWEWDDNLPVHRELDWTDLSFRSYQKIPCYLLVVRLKNGQTHSLSVRYNTPFVPRVIEHLVELQMGIADRFVAAEHRGD